MPAVIHVYHESADQLVELIRRAAPRQPVIAVHTPDELRVALGELEILFAPDPPREGWAGAGRLRLVQLLGAGVDRLLPSPDLPAGVEIAGVRGVFAAEVAEHALAMMLAHAKRLVQLVDDQRARRFEEAPRPTLAGELVTILGHGEIGRRLARAAAALDMRVKVVSRTGSGVAGAGIELMSAAALPDAVRDARYVVVAVPLTPTTANLIDAALLARMRPDAFLVNVARGGIVDEHALAQALSAGRLGGAALDVFVEEPLPRDHPLWTIPGLMISPHVAGLGERYLERCVDVLLANVAAYETGAPRRGLVARDVGY